MLDAFGPPSMLIDPNYEIVHISEHAGRYLRMAGGEPSRNLLRSAHPDIKLELRSLMIEASQMGQASRQISIGMEDKVTLLEVSARSLAGTSALSGFTLVVFEEIEQGHPAPANKTATSKEDTNAILQNVEEQLRQTRDQLRAIVEEHETSTEELKASNEELQAMNEELRSASEELETGKEELQSLNEELSTVNVELKDKVEEVSRANSDLQNLMASTRIATLFVDRAMCVKRYTPSLQEIFNIIPTDVGRPLAHLTHNLASDGLVADVERVLQNLQTVEREVSTKDGRWYILQDLLLPYRTTDDKITGVVITFTDIQERKNAEEALGSPGRTFAAISGELAGLRHHDTGCGRKLCELESCLREYIWVLSDGDYRAAISYDFYGRRQSRRARQAGVRAPPNGKANRSTKDGMFARMVLDSTSAV